MNLVWVALAWGLYGLVHSWLASDRVKDWVAAHYPAMLPAYRLTYNALAVILLLPLSWLTVRADGPIAWPVPGWLAALGAIVSLTGFLYSLKHYDLAAFLGTRQWRAQTGPDVGEALVISPLHRVVRHPWYALGLLFLWTRPMTAAWISAACAITVYVLVGSRLEEEKLLARFGEPYRRYCLRVPALLPLPWRYLRRSEAQALETQAAAGRRPVSR